MAMSATPLTGGAGTDPRFARTLARARRHSRLVRWLRIGLPALGALMIAGLGFVAVVSSVVPAGLSLDSLAVEDGELVMTNPRLVGFDERDQPYSLDAERATQNVADPDRFQLQEVLAEIPLADGSRATVLSRGGAYDRSADRITIPDAFTVTIDDGSVAEVEGGEIDIRAETFVSRGPVDLRRPEARIRAEAMRLERSGRIATFTGGVRVTIEPGSPMAPPTMRGDAAMREGAGPSSGTASGDQNR